MHHRSVVSLIGRSRANESSRILPDSRERDAAGRPAEDADRDWWRHAVVDAIWISPLYASPMKDAGYDVSDYRDTDPVLGDLGGAEGLVREAHAHGTAHPQAC